MLWVSEGISVYYQDLILNRAALFKYEETLEKFRSLIERYENSPGRLFQSATQASFDTWILFFTRGENTANTTISYYDKGAVLGLLLDLKIRHESKNKKSLDDVMRTLYQEFYKKKKRGFTDQEFREVCESTAGCALQEIFDVYASTTKDIDYEKYFLYAGFLAEVEVKEAPGAWFGAATQDQGGNPVISSVEWNSPASLAGLSAQDEIVALDGIRVTSRTLADLLITRKPGDKVRIHLWRRNTIREVEVVLGKKTERSLRIKYPSVSSPLSSEICKAWIRE
jgi:predicted metalloprotease with PDZ domain